MKSIFAIFKQVSTETDRPFRVIETYLTSEGMRSRICSGAFHSLEIAQSWIDHFQDEEM
jgi:hypothetical protein